MTDEKDPPVFEPFAVQELFLDGFFSDARLQENTFRCTAFTVQSIPGDGHESIPVAVVRLIMAPRTARHLIEIISHVLRQSEAQSRVSKNRRRRV